MTANGNDREGLLVLVKDIDLLFRWSVREGSSGARLDRFLVIL